MGRNLVRVRLFCRVNYITEPQISPEVKFQRDSRCASRGGCTEGEELR